MNQPRWKNTLRQETGASLIAAVLFFALCGMGASFLLALASSGSPNISSNLQEEQKRFAVESAASFLRDMLSASENTVKIKEKITEDADGTLQDHAIYYYYVGTNGTEDEESWTPFAVRPSILDSFIQEIYTHTKTHRRFSPEAKQFTLSVEAGKNNDRNELPYLKTEVSLSMDSDYGITAIVSEMQTASDREENRWERRLTLPAQVETITETFTEECDSKEPLEEEALRITTIHLTTIRWENGRIEKELLKP